MARPTTWGTPDKSDRYLKPRGTAFPLIVGLTAGGLVAGALFAAQAIGARAALAPGPVSSAHAPMADRCGECHSEGRGVSSERCERCHDAAGAKNLTHLAHVAAAAPDGTGAGVEIPCDRCHSEHEGRAARPDAVSSAQCAQCHFRSFSVHPEFAVVRDGRRERPGVRFDHETHVGLLVDAGGGGGSAVCTRCHEPSPAARDFQPVAFDRHCADCHGEPSWRHADPALLTDWHGLRRRLDPAGFAAERGALLARAVRLRERLARIGRPPEGGQAPPPVLTLGAKKQLERALEEAEARLALMPPGDSGSGPAPPAPGEPERLRQALDALIVPCRGCHPPGAGGAFVPVRAAGRVLTGAAFLHAPHLLYMDCARCHAAIAQSREAEQLHLEGIATCRNCHGAAGVRDDCQNCHRYHPRGAW